LRCVGQSNTAVAPSIRWCLHPTPQRRLSFTTSSVPTVSCCYNSRLKSSVPAWRFAMRRLSALVTLLLLPLGAAADPPNIKETINRGLTFLAKDNLTWKQTRQCAECHHAPFTLWALNEGKKHGYNVDEKALAELTSWVLTKEHLARLVAKPPKQEQI